MQKSHLTSAGWQVTLCDPVSYVISHSGEVSLHTAISWLFFYILILWLFCWMTRQESESNWAVYLKKFKQWWRTWNNNVKIARSVTWNGCVESTANGKDGVKLGCQFFIVPATIRLKPPQLEYTCRALNNTTIGKYIAVSEWVEA